ncbi:MAG: hypothetical protein ACPL7M_15360, partial [Bryobacteraceae bacterium]
MSRLPIPGLRRAALAGVLFVIVAATGCSRQGRAPAAGPKQETEILFRRMQATWNQIFTSEGSGEYRMARFVVYVREKDTKCGRLTGGVHYCP